MEVKIHTQIFLNADEFALLEKASMLLHDAYMDIPTGAPEEALAQQAWESIDAFTDICEHAEVIYEDEDTV